VSDRPSRPVDHEWKDHEGEFALDTAPPSRVQALVDGAAFFAVDWEVAEQLFGSVRGGHESFEAVSAALQACVERAVRYLTAEAGVRQFLVTGAKLNGDPNVHDVAQVIAPECRVVYLVLDPIMLAHAHQLRSTTPEGATAYVQARMSDPEEILRQAAATLDLSQPVGVLLPGTLPFVRRDSTAYRITGGLMDGLGAGSHLMVLHHGSDLFVEEHAELWRLLDRLAAEGKTWGVAPRSHSEVTKFFDGLDLVEPGVVPIEEWRATPDPQAAWRVALYAAVGAKP
jgi:hypothetical protein